MGEALDKDAINEFAIATTERMQGLSPNDAMVGLSYVVEDTALQLDLDLEDFFTAVREIRRSRGQ